MSTHRSTALLILMAACLATSSCHVGQRLLSVEIEVDDRLVLQGHCGVRDDTPVPEMWSVVDDIPFELADADGSTQPADDGTLQLDGNVVVTIRHVDRELTSASLSSLTLTREPETSGWSLSASEFARIQQALDE